jgi:hypothetical protein
MATKKPRMMVWMLIEVKVLRASPFFVLVPWSFSILARRWVLRKRMNGKPLKWAGTRGHCAGVLARIVFRRTSGL